MLKLLLFFFVVLIYDINGVCTNNDDYSIEILFLLDGTPSDVDSTQWQLQIDAVTNYVSEMKNSTKVAITQMGASFSSMPSYTTVSDLKSQTISLTQDTGLTSRNPAITIQSAVSNGFTDTFAQQKLLIIFTAGEITGTGTNYCGWNYEVKSKLIEVIIIGIGNSFYPGIGSDPSDGYAQLQFQCLLKDNQDVDQSTNKGLNIVSDFTQLTTITSDLKGNYFCIPNTQRLFVVTEIRPSSASNQFIEILNYGPPFSTANIEFTGNVLSRTGVSSGTATILQGQIVVISDQAITLCSTNCLVPSAGAQTLTTAGWQAATQINWSVGVTIGGLAITITHSTTNNEWWIADDGESYELFVIGGNPTFSDNWISSYNPNEGTPGGYGYSNTAVRRDFSMAQIDGDEKCYVISQPGTRSTCSNCYNTNTKICDCSGLASQFSGTIFYANELDPSVCRKMPRMISSYGCNVFPQGSGANEAFRFGTTAPNTDMDFWLLYIEYPKAGGLPYDSPIIAGRTYQSIPSSVSNPTDGYTANTDTRPSNTAAGNKMGVTDRTDGTNVGDLINCGFGTLNPTVRPTSEPTLTPSNIPSGTPTKRPTSGEPIVRLQDLECTTERCGCPLLFVDCASDIYPLQEILRSTSTADSLEIIQATIEILDSIYLADALFDVPVEVNWRITFKDICRSDLINQTSSELECIDPITTKEQLAILFDPPLDINDSANANFTFFNDITITPMNGTVTIDGTGDSRVGAIAITEFKENEFLNPLTFLSGLYRARFLLQIESCNQVPSGNCFIGDPKRYILSYEIGKQPDGGTRVGNEIPTWIWWIIIPLIIFLIIIALLVYKYWWKKRHADEELKKEEADLDDVIKENELGFAHDLDTGNIANNPLAKVNPIMTGPVNPQHVDPATRQNQRIDEVARVRVEQFNVRQEYGQTQQQQRNIVPQNSYDPY